MKKFILVISSVLMIFSICFAYDSSIYEGIWQHKSRGLTINFCFKNGKIYFLKINDKEYAKEAKFNFVWGVPSIYPFLTISFSADNKKHLLYLVINGNSDKHDEYRIVGFYEQSTFKEDTHGLLVRSESSFVSFFEIDAKNKTQE